MVRRVGPAPWFMALCLVRIGPNAVRDPDPGPSHAHESPAM